MIYNINNKKRYQFTWIAKISIYLNCRLPCLLLLIIQPYKTILNIVWQHRQLTSEKCISLTQQVIIQER